MSRRWLFWPTPAGGPLFFDTFTAASDENLEDHTPDIGTDWSKDFVNGADFSFVVVAASDTIHSSVDSTGSRGALYGISPAPTGNYTVEYTIVSLTDVHAESEIDIVLRYDAAFTTNDYAVVVIYPAASYVEIREWELPSTLNIIDFNDAVTFQDGSVVRVEVGTSTITVYVDDVEVVTGTTIATTDGEVGLVLGFGEDAGARLDTDLHIDDFTVTED